MNNSDDLDPRLQHWYKLLAKEQPSPELDAKILTAAQEAMKKPSRWLMPFSMAASVVMVSSLVLYLAKQPQQLEQAITPSEQRVAEPKVAAPAPTNDSMKASNSDTLLGGSAANSYPQTEHAKPLAKAKPSASVAIEEPMSVRVDVHQNRVANQAKEIKEEVANITSSPEPVLLKQDAPERQLRDDNSSLEEIHQPVVSDSAMPEQRALAAAPSMSAGAIAPLAKMQAKKKEATYKAKLASRKSAASVIEGVGFGMNQEQLLAMGFTCQVDFCSKILNLPQQVNYWGVPVSQALLKAQLQGDKVSQLELIPQVDINTVVQAIKPLGIATDSVCDEQKGAVLKRVINGYLLQVYQQDNNVKVVICVAE